MSRLTWQNVSAPDFGGSTQSLGLAADLFDRAFSRANVGVGQAKGLFEDQAEAELARRLMSFQDEDALGTAIQSGDIWDGINAKYLSPEAMMSAGKQQDTLLGRERDRFGLKSAEQSFDIRAAEFEDYNEDRDYRDSQRETMKQAGALYSQFAEGLYNSDPAVAAEAQKGFNAGLAGLGLTYDQFRGMVQDGRSDGISRYNTEKDRFRFGIEQYDFSERLEDDAAEDQAQEIAQYVGQNFSDPALIEEYINNLDVSAKVYGRVRGLAGLGSGGGGGSSAVTSGAGIGVGPDGISPLTVMNYEARASGISSVPERVKTLGDAVDFAKTVNRANKKRTGSNGSSAMGLYQIVGSTMESTARSLFGNDWKSKPFTPEMQDILAKDIFEKNRSSGAALRKQWVSLTPAEANRLVKLPWEQARDIIAKKESGGIPSAIFASPVSPREDVANRVVIDSGTAEQRNTFSEDPWVRSYYNESSSNAQLNMSETLREVKRMEPRLSNMTDKQLQDGIDLIMTEARKKKLPMNRAQAANFLITSLRSTDWWKSDFGDVIRGRSSLKVDKDILRQGLDYIKNGQGMGERGGRSSIEITRQESQAARDSVMKAEAAWQRAQTLRVGSPERQRAYENLVEARNAYRLVQASLARTPDVVGEDPEATQPRRGTGPVSRPSTRRGNALPSSVDLFRDFRR